MFNSVLQFLYNGIQAVFSWFQSLFNSMAGSWDFLFSFIGIYFVARFILGPIVGFVAGGVGSDRAPRSRDKSYSTSSVRLGRHLTDHHPD